MKASLQIILLSSFLYLLVNLPNLPNHHVHKRVIDGQKRVVVDGRPESETKACLKVFGTLHEGQRTFRKKRIFGKRENGKYRVSFVCKGCENAGRKF